MRVCPSVEPKTAAVGTDPRIMLPHARLLHWNEALPLAVMLYMSWNPPTGASVPKSGLEAEGPWPPFRLGKIWQLSAHWHERENRMPRTQKEGEPMRKEATAAHQ